MKTTQALDIIDRFYAGQKTGYAKLCAAFMLESAGLIAHLVPTYTRDALQLARQFWLEDKEDPATLDRVREMCWAELDRCDEESSAYRAGRAILCTLFPQMEDEPDRALCFVFFSNWAEDHHLEQEEIAKRLFVQAGGEKT